MFYLYIYIYIYIIYNINDLANRKTTKETNESKSNWRSLRGKSHPSSRVVSTWSTSALWSVEVVVVVVGQRQMMKL